VGADLGLRNRFNGFPLREIALTTTQLKQGVNERSTYIFLAKKENGREILLTRLLIFGR